jgi:hypothetical protein
VPSVHGARGVRGSFRPQASLGLVPQLLLSWAAGSPSRDSASPSATCPRASRFPALPPAG